MAVIQTFDTLRTKVLRNLDEATDTSTTQALAGQFLNQAQLLRCTQHTWPFMLWESSETITCVANQRVYPLHEEFFKPFYLFNRTSQQYLQEIPERELAAVGARWNTDTQTSLMFRNAGYGQVRIQPSSASVITIVSSSASDASADKALTIRGETSAGLIASEDLTPNGTSSASTTTSFRKILSVTKAATWSGTMTMTSNSGAVTNLVLGPAEFGRRFPQIELLYLPQSADVLEYRFWRQPSEMVDDHDIPDIPPPFSDILVWDALLQFAGYITDVSEKSMVVWRAMQESMDRSLRQTFFEGQWLNARPRYIRAVEDEFDGSRGASF